MENIYDKKYCYPNTNVLKNKFKIKDNESLKEVEEGITSINIAEIYSNNFIKGDLNFEHLQAMHRHIFKDIYFFAGEIRTVDISKSDMFCLNQYINSFSKDIFNNLKKDNYLMGLSCEHMCKKLAEYMGDLNALHPFREGNGRTQRVFIKTLGKVAGYDIKFYEVSKEQMIEASIKSIRGNNAEFEEMFKRIIKPISKEEQLEVIKSISINNSHILECYKQIYKKSIQDRIKEAQIISNGKQKKRDYKSKEVDR